MNKQVYINTIKVWYEKPQWKALAIAFTAGALFAESNPEIQRFLKICWRQINSMTFQEFHQWLAQEAAN